MKFRPCIDIHNGKVKQIVGGTLKDEGDMADTNFVSKKDSAYYAKMYKDLSLKGGHIILLNGRDSEYYEATKTEAINALQAYPGGLQVGGGINDINACDFLDAGASHVIVTSYVFSDGKICYNNLDCLKNKVGSRHIVLDVSCRKRDDKYYVVTDRWQKFTDTLVNVDLFNSLSEYCDEFLIHAVDVEGKSSGIDEEILSILSKLDNIKTTYAGGIASLDDIMKIKNIGRGKVDFTVGSALKLFGGSIELEEIIRCTQ